MPDARPSKQRLYNERYSRRSPVQLGDLEALHMALGVVDDYLHWLKLVQGWTLTGAGNTIHAQIKEAREIARDLYESSVKTPPQASNLANRLRSHANGCEDFDTEARDMVLAANEIEWLRRLVLDQLRMDKAMGWRSKEWYERALQAVGGVPVETPPQASNLQFDALQHCLKVFQSLADRGRYPQELTPDSPFYLGKQGWEFLTDAIAIPPVETSAVQIAGDVLPMSLAQFEQRASVLLGEEQRKPNPDNALVGFICDAVRLARENERLAKSPLKTSCAKRLISGGRVCLLPKEHDGECSPYPPENENG